MYQCFEVGVVVERHSARGLRVRRKCIAVRRGFRFGRTEESCKRGLDEFAETESAEVQLRTLAEQVACVNVDIVAVEIYRENRLGVEDAVVVVLQDFEHDLHCAEIVEVEECAEIDTRGRIILAAEVVGYVDIEVRTREVAFGIDESQDEVEDFAEFDDVLSAVGERCSAVVREVDAEAEVQRGLLDVRIVGDRHTVLVEVGIGAVRIRLYSVASDHHRVLVCPKSETVEFDLETEVADCDIVARRGHVVGVRRGRRKGARTESGVGGDEHVFVRAVADECAVVAEFRIRTVRARYSHVRADTVGVDRKRVLLGCGIEHFDEVVTAVSVDTREVVTVTRPSGQPFTFGEVVVCGDCRRAVCISRKHVFLGFEEHIFAVCRGGISAVRILRICLLARPVDCVFASEYVESYPSFLARHKAEVDEDAGCSAAEVDDETAGVNIGGLREFGQIFGDVRKILDKHTDEVADKAVVETDCDNVVRDEELSDNHTDYVPNILTDEVADESHIDFVRTCLRARFVCGTVRTEESAEVESFEFEFAEEVAHADYVVHILKVEVEIEFSVYDLRPKFRNRRVEVAVRVRTVEVGIVFDSDIRFETVECVHQGTAVDYVVHEVLNVETRLNVDACADGAFKRRVSPGHGGQDEFKVIVQVGRDELGHLFGPVDDVAEFEGEVEAEVDFHAFEVTEERFDIEVRSAEQVAEVERHDLRVVGEVGDGLVVYSALFHYDVYSVNEYEVCDFCKLSRFTGADELVERALFGAVPHVAVLVVEFFVKYAYKLGFATLEYPYSACYRRVECAFACIDVRCLHVVLVVYFDDAGAVRGLRVADFDVGVRVRSAVVASEVCIVERIVVRRVGIRIVRILIGGVAFVETFHGAEVDNRTVFGAVEELQFDEEVNHALRAVLVEECEVDTDGVRAEFEVNADGEVRENVFVEVESEHAEEQVHEALGYLESKRAGVEVDEHSGNGRIRIFADYSVRRRKCVAFGRAEGNRAVEKSYYEIFNRVLTEVDGEFRAFAEEPFEVEVESCNAGVLVAVVVQTEHMSEGAVRAVFGVVLSAPCVDCEVDIEDIHLHFGQEVESEGETYFDFKQHFSAEVFEDLERNSVKVAEESAEDFRDVGFDASGVKHEVVCAEVVARRELLISALIHGVSVFGCHVCARCGVVKVRKRVRRARRIEECEIFADGNVIVITRGVNSSADGEGDIEHIVGVDVGDFLASVVEGEARHFALDLVEVIRPIVGGIVRRKVFCESNVGSVPFVIHVVRSLFQGIARHACELCACGRRKDEFVVGVIPYVFAVAVDLDGFVSVACLLDDIGTGCADVEVSVGKFAETVFLAVVGGISHVHVTIFLSLVEGVGREFDTRIVTEFVDFELEIEVVDVSATTEIGACGEVNHLTVLEVYGGEVFLDVLIHAVRIDVEVFCGDDVVFAVVIHIAVVIRVVVEDVHAVVLVAVRRTFYPLVGGVFVTDEYVEIIFDSEILRTFGSRFAVCGLIFGRSYVLLFSRTEFGESDVDAEFIFPQIEHYGEERLPDAFFLDGNEHIVVCDLCERIVDVDGRIRGRFLVLTVAHVVVGVGCGGCILSREVLIIAVRVSLRVFLFKRSRLGEELIVVGTAVDYSDIRFVGRERVVELGARRHLRFVIRDFCVGEPVAHLGLEIVDGLARGFYRIVSTACVILFITEAEIGLSSFVRIGARIIFVEVSRAVGVDLDVRLFGEVIVELQSVFAEQQFEERVDIVRLNYRTNIGVGDSDAPNECGDIRRYIVAEEREFRTRSRNGVAGCKCFGISFSAEYIGKEVACDVTERIGVDIHARDREVTEVEVETALHAFVGAVIVLIEVGRVVTVSLVAVEHQVGGCGYEFVFAVCGVVVVVTALGHEVMAVSFLGGNVVVAVRIDFGRREFFKLTADHIETEESTSFALRNGRVVFLFIHCGGVQDDGRVDEAEQVADIELLTAECVDDDIEQVDDGNVCVEVAYINVNVELTEVIDECRELDFDVDDEFHLSVEVAVHIRNRCDFRFEGIGIHIREEHFENFAQIDIRILLEGRGDIDNLGEGDTVEFGDFFVFCELFRRERIFVFGGEFEGYVTHADEEAEFRVVAVCVRRVTRLTTIDYRAFVSSAGVIVSIVSSLLRDGFVGREFAIRTVVEAIELAVVVLSEVVVAFDLAFFVAYDGGFVVAEFDVAVAFDGDGCADFDVETVVYIEVNVCAKEQIVGDIIAEVETVDQQFENGAEELVRNAYGERTSVDEQQYVYFACACGRRRECFARRVFGEFGVGVCVVEDTAEVLFDESRNESGGYAEFGQVEERYVDIEDVLYVVCGKPNVFGTRFGNVDEFEFNLGVEKFGEVEHDTDVETEVCGRVSLRGGRNVNLDAFEVAEDLCENHTEVDFTFGDTEFEFNREVEGYGGFVERCKCNVFLAVSALFFEYVRGHEGVACAESDIEAVEFETYINRVCGDFESNAELFEFGEIVGLSEVGAFLFLHVTEVSVRKGIDLGVTARVDIVSFGGAVTVLCDFNRVYRVEVDAVSDVDGITLGVEVFRFRLESVSVAFVVFAFDNEDIFSADFLVRAVFAEDVLGFGFGDYSCVSTVRLVFFPDDFVIVSVSFVGGQNEDITVVSCARADVSVVLVVRQFPIVRGGVLVRFCEGHVVSGRARGDFFVGFRKDIVTLDVFCFTAEVDGFEIISTLFVFGCGDYVVCVTVVEFLDGRRGVNRKVGVDVLAGFEAEGNFEFVEDFFEGTEVGKKCADEKRDNGLRDDDLSCDVGMDKADDCVSFHGVIARGGVFTDEVDAFVGCRKCVALTGRVGAVVTADEFDEHIHEVRDIGVTFGDVEEFYAVEIEVTVVEIDTALYDIVAVCVGYDIAVLVLLEDFECDFEGVEVAVCEECVHISADERAYIKGVEIEFQADTD